MQLVCRDRNRLALEAGEALHDVAEEARFALLAVGDDIDTGLGLSADDVEVHVDPEDLEIVDGERPSRHAITRIVSPRARPSAISSRSPT